MLPLLGEGEHVTLSVGQVCEALRRFNGLPVLRQTGVDSLDFIICRLKLEDRGVKNGCCAVDYQGFE